MKIDFSQFDGIISAKVVTNDGGTRVEIEFKNGSKIWINPENDGVLYWTPEQKMCEFPSVQVLVDLGAGHSYGEKPNITLRTPSIVHAE